LSIVDEINAALRGMGLRIVEPRASAICFALQSWCCRLPALLTMLIIDGGVFHHQALSFECVLVWHSTLKPQRCSLSSSPLASLLSRHNSNCRSTLRSWISTTLLVRTIKREENENLTNFLLFRLFHCSVPALRGNYTVP
jgi:hypothetical protein